jgi:hypothetical protein
LASIFFFPGSILRTRITRGRAGSAVLRLRFVVPHPGVHPAAKPLAQQANPRDLSRYHVPDPRSPHQLRQPAEACRVFELQDYVASRTLLWAGYAVRMPKDRLMKMPMLSRVQSLRLPYGQVMIYSRSLERHLTYSNLPLSFTA